MNFLQLLIKTYKESYKGTKLFFLVIIPLVMLAIYGTDPDTGLIKNLPIGTNLSNTLLILIPVFLYYAVLYLGRKILFDFINLGELYSKAKEDPVASALIFVGVAITSLALAVVILAATSGYVKLPI